MIKSANTRNRDRVCLFKTKQKVKKFILKTLMANYGRKLTIVIFMDAVATATVMT